MNTFLGRYRNVCFFSLTMFLTFFIIRFWITALILFHVTLWFVWAYTSAGIRFDTCLDRADQGVVDYWIIWVQILF